MPSTIKDIAQYTGLSIATISKHINGGNVLEKNREMIEEAIKALDYSVNEAARSLKTKRSGYVGLLMPALTNQFMMEIVNNIQAQMRAKGWGVSLCCLHSGSSEQRKKEEYEAVRFLLRKGVDGLINMPMNEDGGHLKEVLNKGIPVTLLDKHIAELAGQVNSVVIDNVGACRQLTDELLNAGHRRIIGVFGTTDNYTSSRRYEGFLDACRQRGFDPDPNDIIFKDGGTKEENAKKFHESIKNGATAVLASAENEMRFALKELRRCGLSYPEDISLAGFDGGPDTQYIGITAIVQPKEELSSLASDIMCQNLEAVAQERVFLPQLRTLSAHLYEGKSIKQIV